MWTAKLNDGRTVTGLTCKWPDIKDLVIGLSFEHRGIIHSLPDGQANYVFFNSASSGINGGNITLESRVIGCTLPNQTSIFLRFHEKTGEVAVEIKTEN